MKFGLYKWINIAVYYGSIDCNHNVYIAITDCRHENADLEGIITPSLL